MTRFPGNPTSLDDDVPDLDADFVESEEGEGVVQGVMDVSNQTKPFDHSDSGSGDQGGDSDGRVRARRATVVSPIPAMLAASMTTLPEVKPAAAPSGHAPAAIPGSAGQHDSGGGYTVQVQGSSDADRYNRVSDLIASMRSAFDVRDF
ncbi:MAG TPA: hypothetical protein VMU50_06045, partial [Polyangia bacterium]|nr:hypothetical protein [Polyangia bacterium]